MLGRAVLLVSTTALLAIPFAACGGKTALLDLETDGGVDARPTSTTTSPTSTTTSPTPTTTTTSPTPACPPSRPVDGSSCSPGLSCMYPCSPGFPTSIRATCSGGRWTHVDVESCPSTPPPGGTCEECVATTCGAEQAACRKDPAALKGCNDLITCINACSDADCANKCIADSTSAEGKALVGCVVDKCSVACGG